MDAYIKKPSDFIKGGRMSFVGIKKQEDRDALFLYLKAETTPKQAQ
jgi:cytochrome c2